MSPFLSFLLTFILPIAIFIGIGQLMSRALMKRMGGSMGVLLHLGHSHLPVRQHGQEGAVVHLGDLLAHEPGKQERVEQDHHHQDDGIIEDQRFSVLRLALRALSSPPFLS